MFNCSGFIHYTNHVFQIITVILWQYFSKAIILFTHFVFCGHIINSQPMFSENYYSFITPVFIHPGSIIRCFTFIFRSNLLINNLMFIWNIYSFVDDISCLLLIIGSFMFFTLYYSLSFSCLIIFLYSIWCLCFYSPFVQCCIHVYLSMIFITFFIFLISGYSLSFLYFSSV